MSRTVGHKEPLDPAQYARQLDVLLTELPLKTRQIREREATR